MIGLILGAALGAAGPAAAQAIVTSDKTEAVSVTIYRAEERGSDEAMNLDWLQGYALVTERRTVTIPAGRAVIRFEGVAGGMLPESAIVTGLPAGVREKNLDADLLSPRNLYARALGRPVTLRRTNRKTGEVREEWAIIRSGPDGAAILQTKDGFEAVNCGSLAEEPVYDGVPPGLPARPTLSIETDSPAPATVTLTLSYLSWGFDWQTNYVVRMRDGGERADLTAWVTLANSDPTSFIDAEMAVVAGKLNREDERNYAGRQEQRLTFRCFYRPVLAMVAPAMQAGMVDTQDGIGEIVVTGMRRMGFMSTPVTVQGEDLGDLKLYRMPIATTIASNAQKQVAMYDKPGVKVAIVYAADLDAVDPDEETPVRLTLRARNKREDGLGVALPAGPVAVFEPLGATDALSGLGYLPDKAVGEDVDVTVGEATQVHVLGQEVERQDEGAAQRSSDFVYSVSNANPWPVSFEAMLDFDSTTYRLEPRSARLGRKNGRTLWAVRVPANGTATLRYRLTRIVD
ncbi:DUF4139 domain-containing protein [Sphingomonas sp. JC676]|uniref:DUF4139 domain-containing protein n=1 Tax=Sphingomonas sp. JC676 TaxID=2768065 RepID=UPI00223C2A93|nr:hypothetical protein [Sphingomonas sp. JC676]